MKKLVLLFIFLLLLAVAGWLYLLKPGKDKQGIISPLATIFTKETKNEAEKPALPLDRYSFPALAESRFTAAPIKVGAEIDKTDEYQAYFFYYLTEEKQRISGQLTLPLSGQKLPLLLMLRGYVDKEYYFTGLGTRSGAMFFAKNGFVVLAPDFLGFGQSDEESADILLNRFRRPETVLSLLASLKNLNQALADKGLEISVDEEKIFLWGHSNGGQIALSVLEITGQSYPTTLWAPVTKAFPESVLQYASEFEDSGRKVISAIDEFSKNYDCSLYSIASYYERINSPLQLHQGTGDTSVAMSDTDLFVERLKELDKTITYYKYPADDHNLKENWDLVVERDLEFFRKFL
ncbi:MAG: prolyl oligopeptidase family serine peptidase [Dehalococcoidales bacterium]|nr:prolyl oligopeptidase family serine peptidase [Dehalococcoidales bacterium]